MKRLIVIDLSHLIFRAFYAIRPLHAPDKTPVNALYGVLSMLIKLFSKNRPDYILLAKDREGPTFRSTEIDPNYKANRTEPPVDLVPQFDLISDLLDTIGLPSLSVENYEADDIIGSVCTQWKNSFDEILIISGDKDLMQLVGGHIKMMDTMKDKNIRRRRRF